jgi:hypothetical protein
VSAVFSPLLSFSHQKSYSSLTTFTSTFCDNTNANNDGSEFRLVNGAFQNAKLRRGEYPCAISSLFVFLADEG